MILLLTAIATLGLPEPVILRGSDPPLAGQVLDISDQGVLVELPPAGDRTTPQRVLVGWDRVARLPAAHQAQAAPFAPIADAAWRARSRLERGDAVAAEPLFEQLFHDYAWRQGPTSALVAEGLLRCRLRRGAQVMAVEPWLSLLAAQTTPVASAPRVLGADWASRSDLDPILDAETGLVPGLPPIWLDWPGLASLTDPAVVPLPATGIADAARSTAAQLAQWYHAAAAFEVGRPVPLPELSDTAPPSVRFVADIVTARAADLPRRAAARDRLIQRLALNLPPWQEAWCRAAIGRSFLREADPDLRVRGILELLHLPARFDQVHPYLAGLALAESVVALERAGDHHAAATLHAELVIRYQGHPALAWPALAELRLSADPGSFARKAPP